MTKNIALLLCALLLVLATACGADDNKLDGTYRAVDPPSTGEMVVEEITFKGDTLTMTSGTVSRDVEYKVDDDTLTLITSFGEFTHTFSREGDSVFLDGVEYQMVKE